MKLFRLYSRFTIVPYLLPGPDLHCAGPFGTFGIFAPFSYIITDEKQKNLSSFTAFSCQKYNSRPKKRKILYHPSAVTLALYHVVNLVLAVAAIFGVSFDENECICR